jgi:hypothetical protein
MRMVLVVKKGSFLNFIILILEHLGAIFHSRGHLPSQRRLFVYNIDVTSANNKCSGHDVPSDKK